MKTNNRQSVGEKTAARLQALGVAFLMPRKEFVSLINRVMREAANTGRLC